MRNSPRSWRREEEFAEVVHRLADDLEIVVLDTEDLVRLALQHEAAARRVRDDRQSRARVRGETGDEASHVGARRREVAVRLQGKAAAVLLRNDHPKPVVLEDGDDHLAEARLVVVGAAAVEVDDRGCFGTGRDARVTAR